METLIALDFNVTINIKMVILCEFYWRMKKASVFKSIGIDPRDWRAKLCLTLPMSNIDVKFNFPWEVG